MSVDIKVPEIRFEGFSEAWVVRNWRETVDISTNMVDPRSSQYGELFHVGPGNIESFTGRFYNNVLKVKDSNLISGKFHFNKGDIIYGKIRPQLAKYVIAPFEGLCSADAYVLNTKSGVIQNYLYAILQSEDFYKYTVSVSSRTGMPKINRDELNIYSYLSPDEPEQTQIGNTFQKLDNLINQHQQKHDKLSNIKKAMLEKMFPKQGETIPEIRFKGFSGEWEESNLSECTDLLTGNPFNSKEFIADGIFLVRGMNVKRGYLDTSPNISEYWPSSKGLERYLLELEDIVIQMDGALIGKSYAKIKPNNLPAILVQRVTRVRCSEVNPEFIYQYIQKDFLNHISGIKTETAVPHLSLHDIRDFSVFLPERSEQIAIGNYFQKLDALINQHQQQITKLNNIKQACLSKMFV